MVLSIGLVRGIIDGNRIDAQEAYGVCVCRGGGGKDGSPEETIKSMARIRRGVTMRDPIESLGEYM